jgi:hypothetical protein
MPERIQYADGTTQGSSATNALASLNYTELVADVTVSAASEAAATTILTAPSVSAGGSDLFVIEFYAARIDVANVAGASLILCLYDNNVVFGGSNATIAQWTSVAAVAQLAPAMIRTPRLAASAGAHVFSVRGYQSGGNATVRGTGSVLKGYLQVMKLVA